MKFIGRKNEIQELNQRYNTNKSQLLVIYGRRRIGKSQLLAEFCKNKNSITFEGIENESTQDQITAFVKQLSSQLKKPLLSKLKLTNWQEAFELLTEHLKSHKTQKTIIIFDEFQWMAAQQSALISLLKYYWDNHWKPLKLMLILCGSIAHFMVEKVIRSKALYGRINWELCLQPLCPQDASKFLSHRGEKEVLKYLMIFGGVPKYLEEIDQKKSFENNINRLCFLSGGYFTNEIDKIFFSQFREARTYKRIVTALAIKNLSLSEISHQLKIQSGGGLKSYLNNLERAGFIRSYPSIDRKSNRDQKFKLFDEFLNFYFKQMFKHRRQIQENQSQPLFQRAVLPHWNSWLGIAFEVFCLKNAMRIAGHAGFADEVLSWGPQFGPQDGKFQIDLVYCRTGGIKTICELKYSEKKVGSCVIPEMERKISLFKKHSGDTVEKMLITSSEVEQSVLDSQYFHHIVTLRDLLSL